MIQMQVIEREGCSLKSQIRKALDAGTIRSFLVVQVKGGLKIKHKKHPGTITLQQGRGPLLVSLVCVNRQREWQLVEAFVGRLVYHFRGNIASINLQPQ